MLFKGNEILSGKAKGIVVGTGKNTLISKKKVENEETQIGPKNPLIESINKFKKIFTWIVLAICVLSWVINIPKFNDPIHRGHYQGALYYFKAALSLAVAALPEGLPLVLSTCLVLGIRRILQKNVIIRQLDAVESLACITNICTGISGTLTTEKISVVELSYFHSPSDIAIHEVSNENDQGISCMTPALFKKITELQSLFLFALLILILYILLY